MDESDAGRADRAGMRAGCASCVAVSCIYSQFWSTLSTRPIRRMAWKATGAVREDPPFAASLRLFQVRSEYDERLSPARLPPIVNYVTSISLPFFQ